LISELHKNAVVAVVISWPVDVSPSRRRRLVVASVPISSPGSSGRNFTCRHVTIGAVWRLESFVCKI
jgi:hypothetical protein